jgi:ATP-binding cassette, subfamily B, bacterial
MSGETPCKVYLKRFLNELLKKFANKFSDFWCLPQLDRILVFLCEPNCGKAGSIKPNPSSDSPEKLAFAWNARCIFNRLADGFFTLNGSVFRLFPFPTCQHFGWRTMTPTTSVRHLSDEFRSIAHCARSVWGMIPGKQKWMLIGAASLMAISSFTNIVSALMLGKIVDTIQWSKTSGAPEASATGTTQIIWILGLIGTMYIVREVISVTRRAMVERSCSRVNQDMQLQLINHVLKLDMQSLSGEKIGALHGRILRSVDGLVRFVRLMFLDFVPALLTGGLALTAVLTKQPILGWLMIGVIPVSVYLTLRQLNNQKGIRLQLMRDSEQIDGTIVEQLHGAEYLRVANTYDRELQRLQSEMERRRKREVMHHFQMSLYGSGKALNEGVFHVSVLALASYLAFQGTITVGEVLAFSVLFLNVMAPLNEIHRVIDEGHEASLRLADYLDLVNKPVDRSFNVTDEHISNPEPTAIATGAAQHNDVQNNADVKLNPAFATIGERSNEKYIQFVDITAGYKLHEANRKPVLSDLSLSIARGETIGVAGASGSGKSTWVKVLLRLLHPASGRLIVGDRDIDDVSRAWIAENVGYVGQNPFVFSGTIAANITYGCNNIEQSQIEMAAKDACLHDEIMRMNGGYEAHIEEMGRNLSGGQRQRLALARLMLKDPPVLILDEATSALDNISERHIQRALANKAKQHTTILIAHRLTTLKHCDRIFVFDEGQIAETGNYESLIQQDGIFAELVRSGEHPAASQATPASQETPALAGFT